MKIDKRGRVTIPKDIRNEFGLDTGTEVEFVIVDGAILRKKTSSKLKLRKWKGYCSSSFRKLGYKSVDRFINDVRG